MPTPRRPRAFWGGLVAGGLLSLGLLAGEGPGKSLVQGNGLAAAKSSVAHGDCLRQCHQRPKAMQFGVPAKAGGQAFQQGPITAVCLGCHQGPPSPQKDLGASKLPAWQGTGSSHVDGPFLERSRSFSKAVDTGGRRPVVLTGQCNGCHNVHSRDKATSLGPTAFDTQGRPLKTRPGLVAQVCYGCHAGSDAARLARTDPDLGALFAPGTLSAHQPGARSGGRPDLPSLRTGLFTGTLDCTSCHDSSDPNGPRGPHASAYPSLLKAAYGREADAPRTGDQANALCYTCHDERSILGNRSFSFHAQHINGFAGSPAPPVLGGAPRPTLRMAPKPRSAGPSWAMGIRPFGAGMGQHTPCATCHDPHGSRKNPSLIAFDKTVVTRSSVGALEFQRTGLGQGSCTLSCHGYDHVQTPY